MGKKILLINGSNRKKKTYLILTQIEELLKKQGYETELLNLFDYDIKECRGCDVTCIHNRGCNTKDDMPIIRQKVLEADGLVLGSPVYLNGVTSRFKSFADRTNNWVHNPAAAGIPTMFVTVTAATGIKDTENFFKHYAVGFGARLGDFVSRKGGAHQQPVTEKEIAKFLKLLGRDKSQYRPKMNELIMFRVQQVMATKFGEGNKQFWADKQLLDKNNYYYYKCKINFLKKGISKLMRKILNKAIKVG